MLRVVRTIIQRINDFLKQSEWGEGINVGIHKSSEGKIIIEWW